MLANVSFGKRRAEVRNLKWLRRYLPFAWAFERTPIKIHSTESMLVTGPSNILFSGAQGCTFLARNQTGWSSEGVNRKAENMNEIWTTSLAAGRKNCGRMTKILPQTFPPIANKSNFIYIIVNCWWGKLPSSECWNRRRFITYSIGQNTVQHQSINQSICRYWHVSNPNTQEWEVVSRAFIIIDTFSETGLHMCT